MSREIKHSVNRGLVIGVILAFSFMLGAIAATLSHTMRPPYCARCHSMKESYRTWANGVSCPVGCLECHTGAKTGVHLAKEIEDETCVKVGCHTREKLFVQNTPDKAPESFNHEVHLKEWAYDRGLRCTACHASQGGERHFGIDKNSCYVCHFVRGEGVVEMVSQPDKPLWECSVCHDKVNKKIQIYEKEFDHISFEKPGVDCNSCHNNSTVHGKGAVNKDSCCQCHDRDDIPEDYSDANDMHYDHMVRHKVGCSPCHEEIEHKMYTDVSKTDTPAVFDITQTEVLLYERMMKGKGGKGVPGMPDPMYVATVSCGGCHRDNLESPVNPEVCNTCHDKGFETILEEQTGLVRHQMDTLEKLLKTRQSSQQGETSEVLETARHNYDLIASDGSLGVHNIKYVKDLLEFSISSLESIPGS